MDSHLREHSRIIVDGPSRAPARSYFKAVGLSDDDLTKPMPCGKSKGGNSRCGRGSAGIQHHRHQRRRVHGHRRNESVPGEPRGHSRLD